MATISLDLSRDLDLPQDQPLPRGEGRDHVDGLLGVLLEPERREVLPSMATTLRRTPISDDTQATKQRRNASASSVAKMSPRWSWAGVPSRKAGTGATA